MKARLKPYIVDVWQLPDEFGSAIVSSSPEWVREAKKNGTLSFNPDSGKWYLSTERDMSIAWFGDYLICFPDGRICFCRRDVFQEIYEEVRE